MEFLNISKNDYSYYINMNWEGSVDNSHDSPSLKVQHVVAVVIYVVTFVVGVPGNALVLWVTGSEVRRSVNAIWFLNLAVADLFSCLPLPIIISSIVQGTWPLSEMACRSLCSFLDFNLNASILLLTTISADRFLIVFKPIWCQQYRVTWLAWLASGVVWIMALMLTIPSFVFGVLIEQPLAKKVFCGVSLELRRQQIGVFNIVLLFLSFLVPLVMMSVCYSCLLLRTWRRPATRSTKTVKVVVAVVTSFFIFWLPYHIFDIVLILCISRNHSLVQILSLDVLWAALAYVNCCINPIIYVTAAQNPHIQVLKSLPARLHQLLTEDLDMKKKSHSHSKVDTGVHKRQTQV